MRLALLPAALVLAACLYAPRGEAADVYKWVDANGVTHYADAPPEDQKYERVRIGSGARTPTPDPAAEAPAPVDGTPVQKDGETTEQAMARYSEARAKNCQIARDNLALMERAPDVQKDVDGDGVPEPMTAEQREEEIQRNRDLVVRSCSE